MATPESKVKNKVKKTLKIYGVYYFMPVQVGYGSPGLDFHCIYKGKGFCIETKAPGGKLTERQKLSIKAVEEAGAPVFVIGEKELDRTIEMQSDWKYSGEAELETWLLGLTY